MKNTVKVKIRDYYLGDYRIEYDGKYITLFGRDKNYEGFRFNDNDPVWYEEMVLVSCVLEVRNARPEITKIGKNKITIQLNISEV